MTRRTITLTLIAIFTTATLTAQTVSSVTRVDSVTFPSFTDSLIRHEVAFFTIKGAYFKDRAALNKPLLKEIPVRHCTDKEVHLSWSTFTSTVSTFIHIYFKGENSNRTLDSIFLVTHSHFLVRFPDTAFQGLPQTNSCNYSGNGKKSEFFSPYYKAFYSADKRRLYIYMQGGTDSDKYEVTWVVVDDKFYTRIVERI